MYRPMKAPLECPDIYKLPYPLLGSYKIDGIRALTVHGCLYSASLKRHANEQAQDMFGEINFLDGEITYGSPTGLDVLNRTASALRARDVTGDFYYWLFDYFESDFCKYTDRLERLKEAVYGFPQYNIIEQRLLKDPVQLLEMETEALQLGYEGLMVRTAEGRYKHGRATNREALIWKIKRFDDTEMIVVSVIEAQENLNEATINAVGLTERSSHKANKEGLRRAGSYLCVDEFGDYVKVQAGKFTHAEREYHYLNQESILNKVIKVKYFGKTPDGAYRFPRAIGVRHAND